MKKLHKSKKNKILAGVLGGLGEYLNMDPTILRVVWVVVTVFTGFFPGILAYLIAALVIPEEGSDNH